MGGEGAPAQTNVLRVVLGLAVALGLAVLAAHPRVRKLEDRLGITVLLSSGVPFLALGVLFRLPAVGILTDDVVTDLRPALEFGLGWLGFAVGMQFDIRELDELPDRSASAVASVSGIPFLAAGSMCLVALIGLDSTWSFSSSIPLATQFQTIASSGALRDALVLGACAAPAAPLAAVAIARSAGSHSATVLARMTALTDLVGVVALALVCSLYRPAETYGAWKLPSVGWLFVTLGMGAVLGALSYLLVRSAKNLPEEVAYLLGAVALSSGMSGYLAIPPLVACAIAGALMINLPLSDLPALKASVGRLERPLYLVFLLLAGAHWNPTAWEGWLLVPVFVIARVVGKLAGAHVAKVAGARDLPDAGTLGLALAPQSPIAIAIIVSYLMLFGAGRAGSVSWLVTACLGGAVVSEIVVQVIVRLRGGLRFDQPSVMALLPHDPPKEPPPAGMGP